MRRDYDTINSRTHPFVMVFSSESCHDVYPFWYAAVLGVFHAEIQQIGSQSSDFRPKSMTFLWVRWLESVEGYTSGRKLAKLPKLRFLPNTDDFAFGFLDPSRVLRGCHLIPSFSDGKITEQLEQTISESQKGFGLIIGIVIMLECE
jgi:hypothetical protein